MKSALFLALTCLLGVQTDAQDITTDLFGDETVAKGDGIEIKRSLLNERFFEYQAALAARGEKIREDKRQQIESEILDKLITHELLKLRSNDTLQRKAAEQADSELTELAAKAGSEKAFRRHLLSIGSNVAKFKERAVERALDDLIVAQELAELIQVSDQEIESYYLTNPEKFILPKKAQARQILLAFTRKDGRPMNPSEKEALRVEAERLRDRARQGDSFEILARRHSDAPKADATGGYEEYAYSQVLPVLASATFTLEPGQISDLVTSKFGYHIIKLEGFVPEQKIELETVRGKVAIFLEKQKIEQHKKAFLTTLRESANLEIMLPR